MAPNSAAIDQIMLNQKTKQCIGIGGHCNRNTDCCSGICNTSDFTGVLKHDRYVCF
jgi:hypothetical protein